MSDFFGGSDDVDGIETPISFPVGLKQSTSLTDAFAQVAINGLNRIIDSEFPSPFLVNDPSRQQFAVGANGQVFRVGQPALTGRGILSNPLLLLAGGAAVFGILFLILRR